MQLIFKPNTMSFLKKLFGKNEAVTPEAERQKTEERQFNTLRDSGVRAMKMREVKLALPYFEKALELRPDDLQTTSYLVETLLQMQEYERVLEPLGRLAVAEPDNLEIQLILAQTQGRTCRYEEMRATTAALLESHSDDARVPYLAAEAAHGLKDEFAAIAYLTQALQIRECYSQALLLRARILAGMGQWREALADTTALAETHAEDEEGLILHADAQAATDDAEGAEATYRNVLALNPFNREAFLHLGKLYETTNRLDKALALYDEAVGEMPDFAEAYKMRGGVKLRLHDEAGATDDLKKSLELRPEMGQELDGEYSNLENRLNDQMRNLNPYKF